MKNYIIYTLFLFPLLTLGGSRSVPVQICFKADRLNSILEVNEHDEMMYGAYSWLSFELMYLDASGIEKKLELTEDLKEVRFDLGYEQVRLINLPNVHHLKNGRTCGDYVLMKLISDGGIRLFEYKGKSTDSSRKRNYNAMDQVNLTDNGEVSKEEYWPYFYLIQKKNGELIMINRKNLKDIYNCFKDCPLFDTPFSKDDILFGKIIMQTKKYNDRCKYNFD